MDGWMDGAILSGSLRWNNAQFFVYIGGEVNFANLIL